MSYTYWLHENVEDDFQEAYSWYEERKKGLGAEFLDTVQSTIAEITEHPESWGSKGNPNYREALLRKFPYVIVYKIYKRKEEIFICAVHHTKKNPQKKYRG